MTFSSVVSFAARSFCILGTLIAGVAVAGASRPDVQPVPALVLKAASPEQPARPAAGHAPVDEDVRQLALVPLDRVLIARAGSASLSPSVDPQNRSLESSGAAAASLPADVSSNVRFGLRLPRPARWISVVATLGLMGFFFLRRIL